MALTKLTAILNKISTLATLITGQASTVKAAFDYDVNVVKDYINNTLTAEIEGLDAKNVKLTGDQTVEGVKTFDSNPVVPTPTTDMQTSTKKYVDDMGTGKSNDLNTHKTSTDHDSRYYTEAELGATTENLSGADKIGVTAIPTLAGENAQDVLESIKDRLDNIGETNTNVELSNSHYATNGQTYTSVGARCDNIDSQVSQAALDLYPGTVKRSLDVLTPLNNLVVNKGTLFNQLIDSYDSWVYWSSAAYGTLSIDNINTKENMPVIVIEKNNSTTECGFKRYIKTFTIGTEDLFGVWIYVTEDDLLNLDNVRFCFYNSTQYTNGYEFTCSVYRLVEGWNFVKFKLSEAAAIGTPTGGTFNACQIRVFTIGANSTNVRIGAIKMNEKLKPIILFNIDDSGMGFYRNAFPYMKEKGIKGTCFVSNRSYRTKYNGETQNEFMSDVEQADMYNNGWEFGNHSKTHNDLVDLKTSFSYEEQYEELSYTHKFLIERNWGKRLLSFSAPNGKYNSVTLQVLKDLGYKILRTSKIGHI